MSKHRKKETVDDITDRIVTLEKTVASLQITLHSKDIDFSNKQREKKQLQQT